MQFEDVFYRRVQESFLCLREGCDNQQIRREHIISKIDRNTGIRTVRAFHEPCDTLFKAEYQLVGGQWQILGKVEVVADARQREQFHTMLRHQQEYSRAIVA